MYNFIKIGFFLLVSVLSVASCSSSKTYAEYLEEEKDAIKNFINSNNIVVVNAKPEGTGDWLSDTGQEIYFKTSNGLYYHQVDLGDGDQAPLVGYTAVLRYIGKDLFGNIIYD